MRSQVVLWYDQSKAVRAVLPGGSSALGLGAKPRSRLTNHVQLTLMLKAHSNLLFAGRRAEEQMTVNRSYANDAASFGGSADLKQLITTAFDAAFEHLAKQRNLIPLALTKEQGRLAISAILDDTDRSTEEVACAMIQPRSAQIEMYAVCYTGQAQQDPTARPMQVVVVVAAERGVPYGYRVAQAYQNKLLGGVNRTNAPFLMGKVGARS